MPSFHDFVLQPSTRAVLAQLEITEPTPIQAEAIPPLLAGKDLIGQSATGSGKTLAYSIPLVERAARNTREVQALVLVPTRELAVQVNSVLSKLATSKRLSTALLVGGRPYGNQISALRYGAQIVIGTPGRVKDHLQRGSLVLSQLRMCVLDEADQMLDTGFAPIIEEILTTTPQTRQMALFSATMPDWVAKLQQKFLTDPVKVTITPASGAQSTIEQIAYQVPQEQKMATLCTLLHATQGESSLIFGKTKYGVEKLGKQLSGLGFTVGTLHGNKSQRAREEVLSAFRHGHVQTLLATNVAARGLDIEGISQVINYELPESSELFTHRIGRTGRMGRQGKAITLLVPSEVPKWRRMARSLGQAVILQRFSLDDIVTTPPQPLAAPEVSETQKPEQISRPEPYTGRKQAPDQERGRRTPDHQERGRRTPDQERGRYAPNHQERGRYAPDQERSYAPNHQERGRYAPDQERGRYAPDQERGYAPDYQERGRYAPDQERSRQMPDQERGRYARPTHGRPPAPGRKGLRNKEEVRQIPARTPGEQLEGSPLPPRPSRNGKRGAGQQALVGRSRTKKHLSSPFVDTEGSYETARRKFRRSR
jgi:ATP-dependent RNA helicase DeaD